jgi:hypothetical protein
MTDQILQIIEDAQDEFMGLNEANLHSAERIAAIIPQWKAYPENKPELEQGCLLMFPSSSAAVDRWTSSGWRYCIGDPIAFLPIPKYKP